MDFPSLLEKKGIPEYLYKPAPQTAAQEIQNALAIISKICQLYPAYEANPPALAEFFITITCKSFQSLAEVAQQTWGLHSALRSHMHSKRDLLHFYNFLNNLWPTDLFLFALRCRRSVLQSKLGDGYKAEVDLSSLALKQSEWTSVAIRLYSAVLKPTTCVQRITVKLLEQDYTDSVPADFLIITLVEEFIGICEAKKANLNASKQLKKPANLRRDQKSEFNLMSYGKFVSSSKKLSTKSSNFSIDEELHNATVMESPPSNEKPVFYRISNGYESQGEELHKCQQELQMVISEKDKLKEALEETVDFCDSVSYEHDLLLIQNSKIKKLLSLVADKLIRLDQDSINDIDFSEVIDDPCIDFKPTGILKESKNQKQGKVRQNLLDLPFSDTAGKEIQKKVVPATPKFSAGGKEFEEDVFVCIENYLPSQPGLLNMKAGDKIKKISELDDWFFGENLQSFAKGFFPPSVLR